MTINGLTPVQNKMMELLKDGLPHSKKELHGCLWDEMGSQSTIRVHLHNLRKKLDPWGLTVVTQFIRRAIHYRLVRLINGNGNLLPVEYVSSSVGSAVRV